MEIWRNKELWQQEPIRPDSCHDWSLNWAQPPQYHAEGQPGPQHQSSEPGHCLNQLAKEILKPSTCPWLGLQFGALQKPWPFPQPGPHSRLSYLHHLPYRWPRDHTGCSSFTSHTAMFTLTASHFRTAAFLLFAQIYWNATGNHPCSFCRRILSRAS